MIHITLLLLHLYIWNKHKEEQNFLIIESLSFVLFSFMVILIFQLEVADFNLQGTYGSDETHYYQWMLLIKNGLAKPDQFPAPLYNLIGSVILKTSIFESVVLIRTFNVLIFSLALNLLYIILYRRYSEYIDKNSFKLLFLIMSLNGIVVWTAIRNLKDILFISLVVILIYATDEIFLDNNNKKKRLKLIITYSTMFLAFQNLRPFGGLLVLLVAFVIFIMKTNRHTKKIISFKYMENKRYLMILTLVLLLFVATFIDLDMLTAFRDLIYTPMEISGNSFVITALEFTRFILGPGPINSIKQIILGNVFVVSTKLADFLIFLGALQWWGLLGFVLAKCMIQPSLMKNSIKLSLDFFAVTIFIIATYTFVYGGTGDTRLRALMYVASYGVIIPFLAFSKKKVFA